MKLNYKKIIAPLIILTIVVLPLFQNCGQNFVSDSASLVDQFENGKLANLADLQIVPVSQSKTVYENSNIILKVYPYSKDTQNFTYQWKKNGQALAGQTVKDLVLTNVSSIDQGQYSVSIKPILNSSSSLQPTEIEWTVGTVSVIPKPTQVKPPEIIQSSTSQSFKNKTPVVLQLIHLENPTATVQWFKDGQALTNSTTDEHVIINPQSSDEGIYYAEISNSEGKIKSPEILLLQEGQNRAPILRQSSPMQELASGQNLTLFADFLSIDAPTYTWYKDNVLLPNYKNSKLVKNLVTKSDEGLYKVVATNSIGSVEKTFLVTVIEEISVLKALANINNAALGSNQVLSTQFSGDVQSIQWFKNDILIPNTTSANLTLTAITLDAEATYKIIAKNNYGQVAQTARVTVLRPPTITGPITGDTKLYTTATSATKSTISLTGQAVGDALTYQWSFKAKNAATFTDIVGATAITYTKATTTMDDEGSYRITFKNASGSVSSVVDVDFVVKPAFTIGLMADVLAEGTTGKSYTVATSGETVRYDWYVNDVLLQSSTSASYTFIPSSAGTKTLKVVAIDPLDSPIVSAASISVVTPVSITTDLTTISPYDGDGGTLYISAKGSNPKYQWYKDNVAITGATSSSLSKNPWLLTDSGAYKVTISNQVSTVTSSTVIITVKEQLPPVITNIQPTTATALVGNSHNFYVYATGGGLKYQWYKDDVAITGATNYVYSINSVVLDSAGVYKVIVSNKGGSIPQSTTLTVQAAQKPVFNQTVYADTTIHVGDILSFSAYAIGGGVKYRIYKNDILMTGKDNLSSGSLYIESAVKDDAAVYKIEAFNSAGSSFVTMKYLVVDQTLPKLTSKASDGTVYVKQSYYLYAYFTGGGIKYKWYRNNQLIPNANYDYYSLYPLDISEGGEFRIEATNTVGTVSQTIKVTVIPDEIPTLTLSGNPTNGSVFLGDTFTINSSATGGNVTYEWYKDSALLTNTSWIYQPRDSYGNIRKALIGDSGVYKLIVKNSAGSATANFTLSVKPTVMPSWTTSVSSESVTYTVGQSMYIYAYATGGSLKYTWYFNNVEIPNYGSEYLTSSQDNDPSTHLVTTKTAGIYKLVVSNDKGSITKTFDVKVTAP